MTADISVMFLEDGRQPIDQVAAALTAFMAGATRSLDIAIYDCALSGQPAEEVRAALAQAAQRGVAIRVGYYAGPHKGFAPPAQVGASASFALSLGVPAEAISGFQVLMHQKYVVRDPEAPTAAVWTGSTNWTNDSWTREENLILQLPSAALARYYRADFEDLWRAGEVDHSGTRDGGATMLSFNGQPVACRVWFSPGQGEDMAHAVADAVRAAQRRIVFASPVLTVGSILGALRDVLNSGQVPVSGIYDRTQMDEVRQQWKAEAQAAWKIDAFGAIAAAANMAGKNSTPYSPTSVHDYMHAKIVVIDDSVFAGSYNFSHSGEENAENLLRIDSPALAEECVSYIGRLVSRYGSGLSS